MAHRAGGVAVLCALLALAGPAAADLQHEAISAALQGDLSGIVDRAAALDPETLSARDQDWLRRFDARFVARTEQPAAVTDSPFAEEIIAAYRAYWTSALRQDEPAEAAEAGLKESLREILARHGRPAPAADDDDGDGDGDGDDLLDHVAAALEDTGLHCLMGRTPPLLELMVWTEQDTTRYEVELTDGTRDVTVVFLGDFVVKGWAHWGTLGRASTGGWATKEALFCLRDDYDLESERFRVSYLQHEGRHFADYLLYPALESADLEYRAKLTELYYADSTRGDLLGMFAGQAAPNPAAPHSIANHAVVTDLAVEMPGDTADAASWAAEDPEAVRSASLRLLRRHDDALERDGQDSTTGVIPARFTPSAPESGSR